MNSMNKHIRHYKDQLQLGHIQKAYRGILKFMNDLRNHLKMAYPDHFISGSIYAGLMDVSYCTFTSPDLKKRDLKMVILFNHRSISFEAWLCGRNKGFQEKYWNLIRSKSWTKYQVPDDITGINAIIKLKLEEQPDFDYPVRLKQKLEKLTLDFSKDIENWLIIHDSE